LTLAYFVEKAHADSRTLPFGHDYEAASARLDAPADIPRTDRDVRDQLALDRADVAARRNHLRELQIVMRLKRSPVTPVRLPDFQIEAGSTPKTPPGELARRGIEDYSVLSNGEKFRADLARIICEAPERIVIDEFHAGGRSANRQVRCARIPEGTGAANSAPSRGRPRRARRSLYRSRRRGRWRR
jgi:hypothetical protein